MQTAYQEFEADISEAWLFPDDSDSPVLRGRAALRVSLLRGAILVGARAELWAAEKCLETAIVGVEVIADLNEPDMFVVHVAMLPDFVASSADLRNAKLVSAERSEFRTKRAGKTPVKAADE